MLTTCQSLLVRASFSLRFCRRYCFQSLPPDIFVQVQGEELNFSFQYLPHCSGGDVVHNSRFSHLVYSLTPPSLFFFPISLIPSLSLAGSKRLIWDRQTSPALCPTSALSSLLFLLIPFPPTFTSIHLSLSDSLRLSLY